MNKKLKRILSGLIITFLLLTIVPFNALQPQQDINQEKNQNNDDEDTEYYEEYEILNSSNKIKLFSNNFKSNDWEISLSYYDRDSKQTIDDKDFFWDASDETYIESLSKEIIVQINYQYNGQNQNYKPGDIKINIENLMYGCEDENIKIISIGTNSTMWNYIQNGYSFDDNKQAYFTFENANEISSSIKGYFQIGYRLYFDGDNAITDIYNKTHFIPEEYEDSCTKKFYKSICATLIDSINDNEINSEYISTNLYRIYSHPWKKQEFTIQENARRYYFPSSILDKSNNYTWIAYEYYIPENDNTTFADETIQTSYPNIKNTGWKIIGTIPDDCIVYNTNYEKLENNYEIIIDKNSLININELPKQYLYVGYPKEKYNGDLTIDNDIELFVNYDSDEWEYENKCNLKINIGDFILDYEQEEGEVATSITKHSEYNPLYNAMIKSDRNFSDYFRKTKWEMSIENNDIPALTNTEIGFDIGFISDEVDEETGKIHYRRLNDNEFFINKIVFPYLLYDKDGTRIAANLYNCELYIRKSGKTDYELYQEFKNPGSKNIEWNFSEEDKIVSFYFRINNVIGGIHSETCGHHPEWQDFYKAFGFETCIKDAKIAETGMYHVFNYIKVYNKDGILLNTLKEDPYKELSEELKKYDMEVHGTSLQRWVGSTSYEPAYKIKSNANLEVEKEMKLNQNDYINERFIGTTTIHLKKGLNHDTYFHNDLLENADIIDASQKIKGFEIYDLLPEGMHLISTKEDILESIIGPSSYYYNYLFDDYLYKSDNNINYNEQLKDSFSMEVVENWNGTGRTWLHIKFDIGEHTMIIHPVTWMNVDYLSLKYKFSISYDSIYENKTYINNVYADWIKNKFLLDGPVQKDDGSIDKNEIDINNNQTSNDILAFDRDELFVDDIFESQQGIIKYVQTDKNNFTTNIAKSSNNSEYQYKIRINTGPSEISNLVIYDNIEQAFKNGQDHWNGKFLGVNTDFAKSQGYNINVYYSEKISPGLLKDDNSWKLYSETIDKDKVKSLAFEYLDDNDKPAKLANKMTYVLINMLSPSDGNITSLSYNNSTASFKDSTYEECNLTSNTVNIKLNDEINKNVNLRFNKKINATDANFKKLKLDKESAYNFFISLKNQETGEIINGLLNSKDGFCVNNIPIGTYIIEEKNDIWFSFVSMVLIKPIEGIEFKKENGNYIITIGATVESGITANIDITNKTDEERFYDNKYDMDNIFNLES